MRSFYDISVGGAERVITMSPAENREIIISGKSYIAAQGLCAFIAELAEEVQQQQTRRAATDEEIASRIESQIEKVLKALDEHGLLSKHLDEKYPLPDGSLSVTGWSMLSEAKTVCKAALRNERGEDINSQVEKTGR